MEQNALGNLPQITWSLIHSKRLVYALTKNPTKNEKENKSHNHSKKLRANDTKLPIIRFNVRLLLNFMARCILYHLRSETKKKSQVMPHLSRYKGFL